MEIYNGVEKIDYSNVELIVDKDNLLFDLNITCNGHVLFAIENAISKALREDFISIKQMQESIPDYENSEWGGGLIRTRQLEQVLLSIRNAINNKIGVIPNFINYKCP